MQGKSDRHWKQLANAITACKGSEAHTHRTRLKGTACGTSSVSIFTRSLSRSPTRPSCPCCPLPHVNSAPPAVTPAVWSAPAQVGSHAISWPAAAADVCCFA